ncbi:MAG TPA: nuclear transport factor 2 family protein [Galbitalea sp.]|jgi:ketosteroid isomerase-like protein|nr:nuclear transport factor 2 family protein [Galbitalea sp.]
MSEAQSNAVNDWMADYRKAWESNDPSEIGALFTDDALYYSEPFIEPSRGREAIIAEWLKRQDAPGGFTFTWHPLAIANDIAFVQGETDYGDVKYSNLWVIRLSPDGRATEFTEWWMDQSKPSGG